MLWAFLSSPLSALCIKVCIEKNGAEVCCYWFGCLLRGWFPVWSLCLFSDCYWGREASGPPRPSLTAPRLGAGVGLCHFSASFSSGSLFLLSVLSLPFLSVLLFIFLLLDSHCSPWYFFPMGFSCKFLVWEKFSKPGVYFSPFPMLQPLWEVETRPVITSLHSRFLIWEGGDDNASPVFTVLQLAG